MTEIVLARHGQTVWNAENRYAGTADVPLTDLGRAQADQLARWSQRAALAAVACSDLARARHTAAPSASAAEVDLRVDRRLREVHFGDGEGRTRSEVKASDPAVFRAFRDRPATRALANAEAGVDAVTRALPALHELVSAHPGQRVLVVCHSVLLRLMLCQLLGLDADDYRRRFPSVNNVALTTVLLSDDDPAAPAALLGFNVPPH